MLGAALLALLGAAAAEPPSVELSGVEALVRSSAPGASDLVIEAPRSSWDLAGRSATFSGGVVARRGELELRCDTLRVSYGADSTLRSAVAEGGVRVERGAYRAGGQRASLELATGVLTLEGEPWLTDGESSLAAQPGAEATIRFLLDDERVDCQRCRLVVGAELLNVQP